MSTVNTANASHTRPKPSQRTNGMCSPKTVTPSVNWMTGVRYCRMPNATSGSRIAAAPNNKRGMVVAIPAVASSTEFPGSSPKVRFGAVTPNTTK